MVQEEQARQRLERSCIPRKGPIGSAQGKLQIRPLHLINVVSNRATTQGVGTFKYLAAREGKLDTMWKKWARVSNWIDLVCYTFDQQYKWGSDPGEPKNLPGKTGSVSLRSIYAFFIDKELREIEETAADWAKAAKTGFEAKWEGTGKPPLTKAENDWKKEAFGTGGYATAAMMKFPRPPTRPAGSGEYGAYGWGDAGHDARDKDPAIGVPTIIT